LQTILRATGDWNNVLAPSINCDATPSCRSASVTGTAAAPANVVTLNSGNVEWVFGAVNHQDADAVTYNQVFINGGEVSRGIYASYHRPVSGAANASNSSVIVSGGTMVAPAFGGFAASSGNDNATASNNIVEISGGAFVDGPLTGNIAGGRALSGSGVATASNNMVKISGSPNLAAKILYGGFPSSDAGGPLVSTGNILHVATTGLAVKGLDWFQRLDFQLPAGLTTGDTVLTVSGTANIDGVLVNISAPGLSVNIGDEFVLIDASDPGATLSGNVAPAARSGTLNGQLYTIARSGNKLVLRINPQASTATSVPVMHPAMLVLLALALGGLAGWRHRRA